MGYWAATQVKGLSHEILIVPEADVVLLTEGSTLVTASLNRTWRGDASPAGSETVARYQTDIEENLDENIEDLVTRLIAKQYRPQPVKRAYIPKSNGERRPLGIPALEDKIVQLATKKILEAIFKVGRKTSSKKFRQKMKAMNLLIHCQSLRYIISMPYPNKRRGCTPEEPDEGKPQIRFCEGAHSNLGANTPIEGGL